MNDAVIDCAVIDSIVVKDAVVRNAVVGNEVINGLAEAWPSVIPYFWQSLSKLSFSR